MTKGPIWLQRMTKRGGIYGLLMAAAGVLVHPVTASVAKTMLTALHLMHAPVAGALSTGDATLSSFLMFLGLLFTAFAKGLQQWAQDYLLDGSAPAGTDGDYADKPTILPGGEPPTPPPGA